MEIPADVQEAMNYEFARAGLEYVDNYRAYKYKGSLGYGAFVTARNRGCCGSYEVTIIDDSGEKWMVGCNHGH